MLKKTQTFCFNFIKKFVNFRNYFFFPFLSDLSCLTLNKFTVDAQEICKNKTLKPKINTAILKINNQLSNDILLSMQSEECWNVITLITLLCVSLC